METKIDLNKSLEEALDYGLNQFRQLTGSNPEAFDMFPYTVDGNTGFLRDVITLINRRLHKEKNK